MTSTETGGQSRNVDDGALALPLFTRIAGKRIILASSSPRRKDILQTIGLTPEISPSKFPENLPHSEFAEKPQDYTVATATEKAIEVYTRLVSESPDDPPELVIAADTIVLLGDLILEKPMSKPENLRMLLDLNGAEHVVATGVVILYPQLTYPGFIVKSFIEETKIRFADNPFHLLQAYVDSEEGLDRAGGYAIQSKGSLLVQSIEGDYFNAVGFPGSAFIRFLSDLLDHDELFEDDED